MKFLNLILFLFSVSAFAHYDNEFIYYHLADNKLPKVNCSQVDCYSEAIKSISSKRVFDFDKINTYRKTPATQIITIGKKAKATVIAIHGLYRSSIQFYEEVRKYNYLGFNVILVTLPGHGPDQENHKNLKFQDWMKYVSDAADLGLMLGEKLIFTGQSTGGLLSFWYSVNHPKNVLAQILIEPAFKVKESIAWAACKLGKAVDSVQSVDFLVRIFTGVSTKNENQVISLNMGCQVHLMSEFLFADVKVKYKTPQIPIGEDVESKRVGYRIPTDSLFYKNQVPTMIAYSEFDNVVDAELIKTVVKLSGVYTGFDKSWHEAIDKKDELSQYMMNGTSEPSAAQKVKAKSRQKVLHDQRVKEATVGDLLLTTYKQRLKGSDIVVNFLASIGNLNEYMHVSYDYRFAMRNYKSFEKKIQRMKRELNELIAEPVATFDYLYFEKLKFLFSESIKSFNAELNSCLYLSGHSKGCLVQNEFNRFYSESLNEKFACLHSYINQVNQNNFDQLDAIISHDNVFCSKGKIPEGVTVAKVISMISERMSDLLKRPGFLDWVKLINQSAEYDLIAFEDLPIALPPEAKDSIKFDY